MAETRSRTWSRALFVLHGAVRVLALAVGGAISLISVAAIAGWVVEPLWLQIVIAFALVVVTPAAIVGRLFPDVSKRRARGLSTEVMALLWLGIATLLVVAVFPALRPRLDSFAEQLEHEGLRVPAAVVHTLTASTSRRLPAHLLPSPAPVDEPKAAGLSSVAPPAAREAAIVPGGAVADAGADATAGMDSAVESGAAPSFELASESPDGAMEPITVEQIIGQLAPSVVTVAVEVGKSVRSGTGFFIDSNGTLLTRGSLVADAIAIAVRLQDGSWVRGGELVAHDAILDTAAVRIAMDVPSVPIRAGHASRPSQDAQLLCIARPVGLIPTIWVGHRQRGEDPVGPTVTTSAPVPFGRQGAPVVDAAGHLVGIVVGKDEIDREALGVTTKIVGVTALRELPSAGAKPRTIGRLPASETW